MKQKESKRKKNKMVNLLNIRTKTQENPLLFNSDTRVM